MHERSVLGLRRAGTGKVTVTFGLADERGHPHAAELLDTSCEVDPKAGTVKFRARVSNPEELLLTGQFMRVRLTPVK